VTISPMATPSANFAGSVLDFAAALLAERNVTPRARIIALTLAEMLPATGTVVYTLANGVWKSRAVAGEIKLESQEISEDAGTLGELAAERKEFVIASADLAREDYAHLNIKRSFATLAYLPLSVEGNLIGGIEIVSYSSAFGDREMDLLGDIPTIAALGMASAIATDQENSRNLESIARLTELYDLELVFSSTLEMDELMPLITSKVKALANAQAVNLWLIDEGDTVLLASIGGKDMTVEQGLHQRPGEGIAANVADTGEPVLIMDAEDPRLSKRNEGVNEGQVFSLMAVPMMHEGKAVGVLEAVNRTDGEPFDEDDVFLLNTVADAASIALHNASLMYAERKIEILETLVKLSTEITSTLNLERVLKAIVNGSQAIVPFERAAISMEHRGKLQLKAVSGEREVNHGAPEIKLLQEMHEWAAISNKELLVVQRDGEVDNEREETRAKFREYFSKAGSTCFYALPLADDQGRVGVLSMESSNPDFLLDVHVEIIKVLAGQATVALRNAELYREVPFIEVLAPILQKKQQFLRMEKRRRSAFVALGVAAALFLAVFPLPMRVEGTAVVAPQRTAQIQPEVEGVIKTVYVREGDPVSKGVIIAEIEDWDYRAQLISARAKQGIALAEMNRALARNDSAEAGRQRVEAEFWTAETQRAEQRVERTKLRAPIEGVVTTPYVENLVGKRLAPGDTFAEVSDTRNAVVDVAVDERDVAILHTGANGSVKLDGFPTSTFKGSVAVISPKTHAELERRVVFVRVEVPNPEGRIRAGMQGHGKVMAGWRPAGYVFFRRTGMWVWEKLWMWFGW
jgi:RND family efflux transporter MFP subunit